MNAMALSPMSWVDAVPAQVPPAREFEQVALVTV